MHAPITWRIHPNKLLLFYPTAQKSIFFFQSFLHLLPFRHKQNVRNIIDKKTLDTFVNLKKKGKSTSKQNFTRVFYVSLILRITCDVYFWLSKEKNFLLLNLINEKNIERESRKRFGRWFCCSDMWYTRTTFTCSVNLLLYLLLSMRLFIPGYLRYLSP